MSPRLALAATSLFLFGFMPARSHPAGFNYDESKVPHYTLPDPLVTLSGKQVETTRQWKTQRRPEVLRLFEEHVYGKSPEPKKIRAKVTSVDKEALGGKAVRKEITISLLGRSDGPQMHLLMYLPKTKKPVPVFLGLNFNGNHAIANDQGITLSKSWMRASDNKGVVNNRATEKSRGSEASRWPVEKILSEGYGVATIYYGDICPDKNGGLTEGIHKHFLKKDQTTPAPDEWGAIAGWAYGLSRALDYLEKDDDVDAKRVAVIGHSRLGKTSLWAGAIDERFAMVISNDSGEGGAALARRKFGETVARINTAFPHWFCDNFNQYNDKEENLPVDQHMLIALIAPRPVYIASAEEDQWADPKGEFLSGKHAEPIYALFGKKGLGVSEMPQVNRPVGETIGYHIRTGKHDVTDYDWEQYLRFANKHFRKK